MAGNAKRARDTCWVRILLLLLFVKGWERPADDIYWNFSGWNRPSIVILVVETDPGLYYIDIYVGFQETHDRFEIEPTLDYMNCMNLFVCWVEKDTQDYGLKQIHYLMWIEYFVGLKQIHYLMWIEYFVGLKQIHCEWIGDPQENFSGLK